MSTTLDFHRTEHVGRVTFRSENGIHILSRAVRSRLGEVLSEIERQPDLRVVVFQAEGRTFIAGAEIHELRALTPESAVTLAREGQSLMQRIAALNAVTVAAIHAACAGGGCELALACDLRFATVSAKIGLPEVSLGILPGWGGTVRVGRLFGSALARRMILSGELLPAAEAHRLGLVDSVVPEEAFPKELEARIQQLLSRGPGAQRAVKALLRRFEGGDVEAELAAEALAFADCYSSGEPAEGTAAFLEKRPPRF